MSTHIYVSCDACHKKVSGPTAPHDWMTLPLHPTASPLHVCGDCWTVLGHDTKQVVDWLRLVVIEAIQEEIQRAQHERTAAADAEVAP